MLALSFLILVGVVLIADGFHHHIEKVTFYFAMAFSLPSNVEHQDACKAQGLQAGRFAVRLLSARARIVRPWRRGLRRRQSSLLGALVNDEGIILAVRAPRSGRHLAKIDKSPVGHIGIWPCPGNRERRVKRRGLRPLLRFGFGRSLPKTYCQ
jgi:hypothetical protein